MILFVTVRTKLFLLFGKYDDKTLHATYATPAAGGIIYSLNVFFSSFLARPYGLTIANIFILSILGGQKLLEH